MVLDQRGNYTHYPPVGTEPVKIGQQAVQVTHLLSLAIVKLGIGGKLELAVPGQLSC